MWGSASDPLTPRPESFLLQNSWLLHHSCCLEKPIPALDTAYIINIMVNFILSLTYCILYFIRLFCNYQREGNKEEAEWMPLVLSFAGTPVKGWCQEPRTSPPFCAFSGIVRDTEPHRALMIIKQNTWHGEYSDDLPGWEFPNYEQVAFQMFSWRKLFRIMNASHHGGKKVL